MWYAPFQLRTPFCCASVSVTIGTSASDRAPPAPLVPVVSFRPPARSFFPHPQHLPSSLSPLPTTSRDSLLSPFPPSPTSPCLPTRLPTCPCLCPCLRLSLPPSPLFPPRSASLEPPLPCPLPPSPRCLLPLLSDSSIFPPGEREREDREPEEDEEEEAANDDNEEAEDEDDGVREERMGAEGEESERESPRPCSCLAVDAAISAAREAAALAAAAAADAVRIADSGAK
ncbi:unnamed protein product [Closterium sp. NIES-53]